MRDIHIFNKMKINYYEKNQNEMIQFQKVCQNML